jgi:hypothetical protein
MSYLIESSPIVPRPRLWRNSTTGWQKIWNISLAIKKDWPPHAKKKISLGDFFLSRSPTHQRVIHSSNAPPQDPISLFTQQSSVPIAPNYDAIHLGCEEDLSVSLDLIPLPNCNLGRTMERRRRCIEGSLNQIGHLPLFMKLHTGGAMIDWWRPGIHHQCCWSSRPITPILTIQARKQLSWNLCCIVQPIQAIKEPSL